LIRYFHHLYGDFLPDFFHPTNYKIYSAILKEKGFRLLTKNRSYQQFPVVLGQMGFSLNKK